MPKGMFLGRLFKTDIYVTLGFVLLMAFLFVRHRENVSAVAAVEVALIVSILVHEFGHVFAVRRFGGGKSVVLLWGLGGLCVHEPVEGVKKRIGISLMGPAFGFLLGAIFWVLDTYALPPKVLPPVAAFMNAMIVINIYYTGLNLLPILPLDGGQAALAAIEAKQGRAKALKTTRRISVLFAASALGLVLIYAPNSVFLVVIVLWLLIQNMVATRYGL